MTNIKLNICREDCDMLGYLLGGFFVCFLLAHSVFFHAMLTCVFGLDLLGFSVLFF